MSIKNKPRVEGKSLAELAAEISDSEIYDIEVARFRVSEAIDSLMRAQGINKSDLAARLGTSRAYVTKILQGNGNFTLETLVKISRALNARYRPAIVPKSVSGVIGIARSSMQIASGSYHLKGPTSGTFMLNPIKTGAMGHANSNVTASTRWLLSKGDFSSSAG